MKALVVYESMFGNTEQIARAIADGLGESLDVDVTEVSNAPAEPAESFYVRDVDGPLVVGEVDRARAWAQQLAASVSTTGS